MTRIIAICNQAGGVGKTTTTRDLGYELATRGSRVLLIDGDSQGTLGVYLGCDPHTQPEEAQFWFPIYGENEEALPPVVSNFGLDIGVANLFLTRGERLLIQQRDTNRLLKAIRLFQPAYDVVLIDCPPHVSEITIQSLIAADELLIPVQTEDKAVTGLRLIQEEIISANKRRTPFLQPLRLLGILPTMYNERLNLHRFHLEGIREFAEKLKCRVFPPISNRVAVKEAGNAQQPLKVFQPNSPVNLEIAAAADAIVPSK